MKIHYIFPRLQYHVLLVILFATFFRNSAFCQIPSLGKADSFVLFSTTGAFTNTGSSYVTGNVGNDGGTFTGFPPGTLIGQIHVADALTASVALDIDSAYDYLTAQTCGSAIGTTLGNNQVLTPGIYCLGSASLLTGILYLDGQGDPNSIFIFKISGAFNADSLSSVVLIDSTSVCNVFWQIDGAVDLKSKSVFRGNILANGAIGMEDSAMLEGRALTKLGAVTINNVQATICYHTLVPLSFSFISFIAQKNTLNSSVDMVWKTASEINSSYFFIERSADGTHFSTIGKIMATKNSDTIIQYHFSDLFPQKGISFYRLNQIYNNGENAYSNMIFIRFQSSDATVDVFPNPMATELNISVIEASRDNLCLFKLYNSAGVEMMSVILNSPLTTISIDSWSAGFYYYKLLQQDTVLSSGKLIAL